MKTLAITTLGCKVNTYESEFYIQELKKLGYQLVDAHKRADVYIINTCAVTNTAASKSRKKISQAVRLNPQALICVVGCYVQAEFEKLKADKRIDILIGSTDKAQLPQLIKQANQQPPVDGLKNVRKDVEFEQLFVKHFLHQHRAYLKIQDGCNQFCSYCIIPLTRGLERSMAKEDVINNLLELWQHHPEVVLTGIHTGRYQTSAENLTDLFSAINALEVQNKRLRLSSIEINEITPTMLNLMQNNPRFAQHLHIPLQSGSDKILRLMGRHYTSAEFKAMIKKIRAVLPNIAISTDVIVGFPGETAEDFNETKEFLMELEFSFLHVFPFSIRSNTKAETFANQVDGVIKHARVKELLALSEQLLVNYQKKFYNKTVEVLFERQQDQTWVGYGSEYFEVKVQTDQPLGGCLKPVRIINYQNKYCEGNLVEDRNG